MVADERLHGREQERVQQPEAKQVGQPADAGQAVGQAPEQRLAQALQPVLAEFHQHLGRAVRQQIEQELEPARKELQREGLLAPESSRQEEPQPVQPRPEKPAQQAGEQRAWLGPTEEQQDIQGFQPGLFRTLLDETRGLVEQQAEQWLERLVPSEVRTHLRASQREQLLALRAWLDIAIQRIEQSECPRRPESIRIE
jgi:hypothetical protein